MCEPMHLQRGVVRHDKGGIGQLMIHERKSAKPETLLILGLMGEKKR